MLKFYYHSIYRKKKKSSKKDSVKTNVKDSVFINMEERGFEEKRQRALEEHFKQAASFEKAGLSFGFSLLSSKPEDVLKNIKKMVKYGLSEKKALEALTTYPAGVFGVLSQTGTVEKGKIANLVITDKPVFEEKSSVKYVFVEGTIFDYSQTKPTKSEKTNKDTSATSGHGHFQ
ncbi:MAG: amidohydrolase family protein [Saprospiraceae bacterium]|nr:amidohydrolase family protein [Saprospiraceae bacterium]